MPSINRDEINEEVYWAWKCSICENMNDVFDELDFAETVVCDHCHDVFTVVDD